MRLKKLIELYTEGFEYKNIKIVMKQSYFDTLEDESLDKENMTIYGYPIEIYDKISVDFYVTEIIE